MLIILILPFVIYNLLTIFLGILRDINKYKQPLSLVFNRLFPLKLSAKKYLLHGVSAGESKVFSGLIEKKNDMDYLLTVHNPLGYQLCKNIFENSIIKPYDNIVSMLLLFIQVRPYILIISTSDTWPIYILLAKIFCKKIILINASFDLKKEYKIKIFNMIFDQIYFRKWNNIIEKNKNYHYLGDLKLLYKINDTKKNHNYFILASAREEEFNLHLDVIDYLIDKNISIIYVPRYLDWKDKFEKGISKYNYKFLDNIDQIDNSKQYQILVFWKFGLLNKLYKYSNYTLMGDSFKLNGHCQNIIEPIVNKNIVFTGPYIKEIEEYVNIFNKVFICQDYNDLIKNIQLIVNNDKLAKRICENNINNLKKQNHIISKKLKNILII